MSQCVACNGPVTVCPSCWVKGLLAQAMRDYGGMIGSMIRSKVEDYLRETNNGQSLPAAGKA